jgi:uncharacterized lipoprotein YehR (DUF1307 family)
MDFFKKMTAFSAAAIMGISALTGCGAGDDYLGKWEAKKLSMGGETYEGDVNGTPVAVAFQIEFKENGEGEILISGVGSQAITWEADGDTVTAKSTEASEGSEAEELKFTKNGDELTAEQDNMNVVLGKVDEFTNAN